MWILFQDFKLYLRDIYFYRVGKIEQKRGINCL